ncbi:MAG: hypothetical protein HWN67_04540 [Candidatus Helarchaeota archaeon]|nr:hypothetical protein [Candidatus Helarchaeota archaeon]
MESISTKTAGVYTDTYPSIIKSWKINKKQVQLGNNSFTFNYEIPYGSPLSIYGMFLKRELFIHLKLNRSFKTDKHLWIPIYILPAT